MAVLYSLMSFVLSARLRTILGAVISLSIGGMMASSSMADSLADSETRLRLAKIAMEAGDYSNAIAQYRNYIHEFGDNTEGYLGLGEALLRAKSTSKALNAFQQVLEVEQENIKALYGRGKAFLEMGRYEESLESFLEGLKVDPEGFDCLNGSAVVHDLLEHHDEAQKIYQTALIKYPHNKSLKTNYGLSLALSGKPEEGIKILQALCQASGASPKDRQNLAIAYGIDRQMDKAAQYFSMDLDRAEVQHNLGILTMIRDTRRKSNALRYLTNKASGHSKSGFQPQTYKDAKLSASEIPDAVSAKDDGELGNHKASRD